ncbi:hypothetical protein ZIOFF_012202 [Zingiber officinale]|uniref:Uncharacterized protein n=1 Tax=Zingiber officinale TaxID=94328 RepID=A0A8J5LQK6_ZINOF|nr:hypothetical protein ZIOFF_012202 [Zingiber officinale]
MNRIKLLNTMWDANQNRVLSLPSSSGDQKDAMSATIFVKRKELWSHIDRTNPAPNSEKEEYVKWEVKDAQIMSWILGSVEPSILLNLKPYKTSREMWDYLKKIYNQSNTAQRFQLELELVSSIKGIAYATQGRFKGNKE